MRAPKKNMHFLSGPVQEGDVIGKHQHSPVPPDSYEESAALVWTGRVPVFPFLSLAVIAHFHQSPLGEGFVVRAGTQSSEEATMSGIESKELIGVLFALLFVLFFFFREG